MRPARGASHVHEPPLDWYSNTLTSKRLDLDPYEQERNTNAIHNDHFGLFLIADHFSLFSFALYSLPRTSFFKSVSSHLDFRSSITDRVRHGRCHYSPLPFSREISISIYQKKELSQNCSSFLFFFCYVSICKFALCFFGLHSTSETLTTHAHLSLWPMNTRVQTLPLEASSKTGPTNSQDWRGQHRCLVVDGNVLNPEKFALTGSRTKDLRCYQDSCDH
jgi:hypothetical protein